MASESVRCQGLTKVRVQCKKPAKDGKYCHFHREKSLPASATGASATGASATKIPTVVHLKRKGGVVVQDCDVYIGRTCNMGGWQLAQSPWCNPYSVKEYGREEALRLYKEHILLLPDLDERLATLSEKRLGCFCKPEPCHGDILVELYRERLLK